MIYRIMAAVNGMSAKTNAIRIIEQKGFLYREAHYDYDENDLSGQHVAKTIGFPEEQVFKTLVVRGVKTGIHVFCVPVCSELDLKKAAKAIGEKSIALIPVKELLSLTGYIRGGCSPIGMKKRYPTHIDESCTLFDEIAISAGERGHQVILHPESILMLTDAELIDVTT